ncbi:MAG TPA: hypothetical protein VKM36_11565 [Balneolaceae bacterium]|nr:hypothetical protein [Balneolaceae bacterium]
MREKGIKNSELRIKNYSPRLTGLGLIIANDIVKAHTDELEIKNKTGVLTCFILKLPCD